MASPDNPKLAGALFVGAGLLFFVGGVLGGFVAAKPAFFSFFGVGAAFIGVGAIFLSRAKTSKRP